MIVETWRVQGSLRSLLSRTSRISNADSDRGENAVHTLSACLQPMIDQLPENYREAIVLSELQGLPQKEVARLQGISLSGAKSRVQRGRALLKVMLDDRCRFNFDTRGQLYDYERKSPDSNGR